MSDQETEATSATERQYFVIRYSNGPWHRLFLNQQFVGDCRCEDGNHFPREWTWPPRLNALEAELRDTRQRLATAEKRLKGIEELIREVDILASKETDSEGWIISYRFNTGAWHRLLGVVNGAELPPHISQLLEVRVDALSPDTSSDDKGLEYLEVMVDDESWDEVVKNLRSTDPDYPADTSSEEGAK